LSPPNQIGTTLKNKSLLNKAPQVLTTTFFGNSRHENEFDKVEKEMA
jgi:hypothetical protein